MKIRLKHFWNIGAGLLALGLLAAGITLQMLDSSLESSAVRQRADTMASLLSAQLSMQLAPYQEAAQRLAHRSAQQQPLSGIRLVERSGITDAKGVSLSKVLKVRIVPAGTSKRDTALPEMTYVCLDLLERSERGEQVPKLEHHLPGTASAHIDIFSPITDPANPQQIAGHVLLNLDPSILTSAMATLPPESGYAELRQMTPQGDAILLATGGNTALKTAVPVTLKRYPDTDWKIAVWPAVAAPVLSRTSASMLMVMAVLALVLLALSQLLPRRMIMAAIRNDSELMNTMFHDIRNGVLMEQYPFRLEEFRQLALPLRKSSETMLEHLRNLEIQTQTDAVTGAATLAYFESRLKRLHQQARTGFPSALMLADIDQFKDVVAQHGAGGSDQLLKHFAGQLIEVVRQSDVVARLEGGRFAILFPMADLKKIEPVLLRLRTRLDLAFNSGNGPPTPFTWSAGLTLVSATDARAQDTLARANVALQTARQEGGNLTITLPPVA